MTYTFATLEVSPPAYAEIRARLLAAEYHHAITNDSDRQEVLDLHGVALVSGPGGPMNANIRQQVAADEELREALENFDQSAGGDITAAREYVVDRVTVLCCNTAILYGQITDRILNRIAEPTSDGEMLEHLAKYIEDTSADLDDEALKAEKLEQVGRLRWYARQARAREAADT